MATGIYSCLASYSIKKQGEKKSHNFAFVCFGKLPVNFLTWGICSTYVSGVEEPIPFLCYPNAQPWPLHPWFLGNGQAGRLAGSQIPPSRVSQLFSRPPHLCPKSGHQAGSVWCQLCQRVQLDSDSPFQSGGEGNISQGCPNHPGMECLELYLFW